MLQHMPYLAARACCSDSRPMWQWAQVVVVLKKEVMKTQSKELEKAAEYRQLLVQAIHSCAVKFPDVAGNVIHLLMGEHLHPS